MTRTAVTHFARVACVVLAKSIDVRLRNQASIAEQDARKRLACSLSLSLP